MGSLNNSPLGLIIKLKNMNDTVYSNAQIEAIKEEERNKVYALFLEELSVSITFDSDEDKEDFFLDVISRVKEKVKSKI